MRTDQQSPSALWEGPISSSSGRQLLFPSLFWSLMAWTATPFFGCGSCLPHKPHTLGHNGLRRFRNRSSSRDKINKAIASVAPISSKYCSGDEGISQRDWQHSSSHVIYPSTPGIGCSASILIILRSGNSKHADNSSSILAEVYEA